MSFNAICENKILAKISGFTVYPFFILGICYAATAIGVASGFFAGGQFVEKLFVEFDRIDQDT